MQKSDKEKKALINAIITLLKDNDVVKSIFSDFEMDVDRIDDIPFTFAKLNVSAKTKDGKVYLNERLLEDGDFSDNIHYIVHEATHWLQQISGSVTYDKSDYEHYLDLPAEIEAFKNQHCFIKSLDGKEKADQYIERLLDFHDFDGESREEKKKELIGE